MTLPRLCPSLLFVLALGLARPAASQELLETQMELNAQALDAATDGDHATAVRLLRSSLALGELNVTWLNLGRVYQLAGECQEARRAFDRVPSTPAVAEPPRSRVLDARRRYMRELDTRCAGTLVVQCDPPTLEIDVAGQRLRCDQPTSLVAGTWRIGARLGGATAERQVVVTPGQTVTIQMSVERPVPLPPDPSPINGWYVAGWSSAGVAVVSGVAATVVYVGLREDLDELESISATPGGDRARYDQLAARVDGGAAVFYLMLGVCAVSAVGSGLFFYKGAHAPVEVSLTPLGGSVSYRF